jgi:hypothetical protein
METDEDLKKMQQEQMKDKDYLEKRALVHAYAMDLVINNLERKERETFRNRLKFGIFIVAVLLLIGVLFR